MPTRITQIETRNSEMPALKGLGENSNQPGISNPERAPTDSNPRRRDQRAHLRLVLKSPQESQKIVDPVCRQVFLRHQTELLFHFSIAHRILEVPAVIFDPGRLACARF